MLHHKSRGRWLLATALAVASTCASSVHGAMPPSVRRMPLGKRLLTEFCAYGFISLVLLALTVAAAVFHKLFGGRKAKRTEGASKNEIGAAEQKWQHHDYECPKCGRQLWAYSYMSGRQRDCPGCGCQVVVPQFATVSNGQGQEPAGEVEPDA